MVGDTPDTFCLSRLLAVSLIGRGVHKRVGHGLRHLDLDEPALAHGVLVQDARRLRQRLAKPTAVKPKREGKTATNRDRSNITPDAIKGKKNIPTLGVRGHQTQKIVGKTATNRENTPDAMLRDY